MVPAWFTLLQSFGIVASFLFAAYAAFREVKARRLGNYLKLIEYHRDIWRLTMDTEGLDRIRKTDQDLIGTPLTPRETQFLTFVFLHITCSYELQKSNHIVRIEQLEYDIRDFMKAPLVRRFWEENQRFYNDDFIAFINKSAGLSEFSRHAPIARDGISRQPQDHSMQPPAFRVQPGSQI